MPNCCGPQLDRPLLSLLDPQAGSLLDQTGYTQPVMFAIEYALASLWRSWGIEPAAVMGHSVGEFAAACIAGVFSLEDGLRLIAERARLMQSLPTGGLMAAVFAAEARVAAALESCTGQVTIAALNGPESIVISGDEPAVRQMLVAIRRARASGPRSWRPRMPFIPTGWIPSSTTLRRVAESVRLLAAEARSDCQPDRPEWPTHPRTPTRPIGVATPVRRCGSPRACRRWPIAVASCFWRSVRARP